METHCDVDIRKCSHTKPFLTANIFCRCHLGFIHPFVSQVSWQFPFECFPIVFCFIKQSNASTLRISLFRELFVTWSTRRFHSKRNFLDAWIIKRSNIKFIAIFLRASKRKKIHKEKLVRDEKKMLRKCCADQKESQMFDYICLFGFIVSASRLDESLRSWCGNELCVGKVCWSQTSLDR